MGLSPQDRDLALRLIRLCGAVFEFSEEEVPEIVDVRVDGDAAASAPMKRHAVVSTASPTALAVVWEGSDAGWPAIVVTYRATLVLKAEDGTVDEARRLAMLRIVNGDWFLNFQAGLTSLAGAESELIDGVPGSGGKRLAGRVHGGFLDDVRPVQRGVLKQVRALSAAHPSYPIFVTGHSQGGADALIGTAALLAATVPVAATFTFAAARALDADAAALLDGRRVVRFERLLDMVPHVPPAKAALLLPRALASLPFIDQLSSLLPRLFRWFRPASWAIDVLTEIRDQAMARLPSGNPAELAARGRVVKFLDLLHRAFELEETDFGEYVSVGDLWYQHDTAHGYAAVTDVDEQIRRYLREFVTRVLQGPALNQPSAHDLGGYGAAFALPDA